MKMFWEVIGMKNVYTGNFVKWVVDKKDGKRYDIGVGRLYLKKDYPKQLLESPENYYKGGCRYDFYYGVAFEQKPDRIEKKGFFGRERRVYSKVHPLSLETEYLDFFGLWKIEGLPLYTDKAVTYIRDKATGREYRRGERVLFFKEDMTPFPLAEHTDRYEYIYEDGYIEPMQTNDYLREINAALLFRK